MSQEDEATKMLKKVAVDMFLIIFLGLGAGISNNMWTPFERGFFCGDESLMYPYSEDTVTVLVLRLVGLGLPLLAFLICEWTLLSKETGTVRVLSFTVPTWIRGFYYVAASFAVGCCLTEIAINTSKAVIGRPRPHFFSVCEPSINCSLPEWQGRYVLPTDYTCTAYTYPQKLADVRKSFLSGHSGFAAFTMFYLAMYIESRVRWSCTNSLRHTLAFGAAWLSWFCALSRVSDYKHHWSDVLAGYTLGILMAIVVWKFGTDLIDTENKSTSEPAAVNQQVSILNRGGREDTDNKENNTHR